MKPKQGTFFKKQKRAHGGSLAENKKRESRPLNPKLSHHITLKSHLAYGVRSLFKHQKMIHSLIHKTAKHFNIKVYEVSVNSNHLHLLIKGPNRIAIQNFFRVLAGHSAQRILKDYPLIIGTKGGAPQATLTQPKKPKKACKKNQRKFWSYLIYSRIVTWGREFQTVARYIQKNILESMQIIAYEPRTKQNKKQNTS